MKYYIFGNTKKSRIIQQSTKKAAYSSDDLIDALEVFKSYINEVRYTNCYLVVDYDNVTPSLFTVYSVDNDLHSKMPFFIIGEWHLGEDKDHIIRADHTSIRRKGFIHEFNNNLLAAKEFHYCIAGKMYASMNIMYSRVSDINGVNVDQSYSRLVGNTCDIMATKKIYNKKFRITSPNWDKYKDEKERKFILYNMKDSLDSIKNSSYEVVASAK